MEPNVKPVIPRWAWAALTLAAVAAVLALFAMEKTSEPAGILKYDVSGHAKVDADHVRFREMARVDLALENPTGLAVTADGRWLVTGENVLLILDASGRELARRELGGTPDCVASGPDGKIYLGMRRNIEVRDAEGLSPSLWPDLGERAWISALAVDENNVYAADSGNRALLRLDPAGNVVGRIGQRDPERGIPGLILPSPHMRVMFDAMGGLWVTNTGRHGFEQYRPDGTLVSSWYKASMGLDGFCGCCNPSAAAFRSDGSVVTAEKGIVRVKVHAPDSSLVGVVAAPESLGAVLNPESGPEDALVVPDVAVDAEDRVLVLHAPWKKILVFEEQPAAG
ncbi:MAG: hypothetical protein GX580_07185 [Candidatus Hydrogenedens sp.]|nr:hypothetical protein [Candidatus Hydrogenedentota bacterium]NLF57403.1 hypothetical protein [Candidatus Hydrogenedens sp.]